MLIHFTILPSLCGAVLHNTRLSKPPLRKQKQPTVMLSCWLSSAIIRTFTVRFPHNLLAFWETVSKCVCACEKAWLVFEYKRASERFLPNRLRVGSCLAQQELGLVPAIIAVCMMCAHDLKAPCVFAGGQKVNNFTAGTHPHKTHLFLNADWKHN